MTTQPTPTRPKATAFQARLRRADHLLNHARRHHNDGFEWAARGCIRDMRIRELYHTWFDHTTFEQRCTHPDYRRLPPGTVYKIADNAQHGDLDEAIAATDQLLQVIHASAHHVTTPHPPKENS